jgi:hypothetical protein
MHMNSAGVVAREGSGLRPCAAGRKLPGRDVPGLRGAGRVAGAGRPGAVPAAESGLLTGTGAGTPNPSPRGKITYDLRHLRIHGLIERVPGTFRYQVTDVGLARALFLTRLHDKFLRTGLAALTGPPGTNRRLASTSRAYTTALDELARQAGLAA